MSFSFSFKENTYISYFIPTPVGWCMYVYIVRVYPSASRVPKLYFAYCTVGRFISTSVYYSTVIPTIRPILRSLQG